MRIESVLTKRSYEHWPSYDLVYEWEDVFKEQLDCLLKNENSFLNNRFFKRLPILPCLIQTNQIAFKFEMFPKVKFRFDNKSNIIPCIIDYYLTDRYLSNFISSYNRNKIICISSKEVFDYLLQKGVNLKLNLVHLPLSISDKYKITEHTKFEKKYDLVLMGRQNPVLRKFLDIYIKKHEDLYYVYREQKGNKFFYYTSQGEYLGDINTREKYISLMKQAKCGLYATPGIDGGEKRTNGFNQVTPRFLELLACGCHVIARYQENSDTLFYDLKKFSVSVDNYETFERLLDHARNNQVDMSVYSNYLSNHYTSKRVKALSNIIEVL